MESSTKTMRAVQYDSIGGGPSALKHVEIPVPSPKDDEILIKIEAASVNPIDWATQLGFLPNQPGKLPFIPVTDVAGEVVQVGSGVTSFKPADKVVALLNPLVGGGLAEYAVASPALTVLRPPEVSAAEGAGFPVAGMTALCALKRVGVKFDGAEQLKNVLITSASGGVGHYAVQLAKAAGLHVTATCGARNAALAKSLGADEVLDYRTPDGAGLKSPSGRKYDGIVYASISEYERAVGLADFEAVLSERGQVVDIVHVGRQPEASGEKRMAAMVVEPRREDLEFLVGLAKEGKVKTVVDSEHPLSNAEEAWAKSMGGHATGKIIVEMGSA